MEGYLAAPSPVFNQIPSNPAVSYNQVVIQKTLIEPLQQNSDTLDTVNIDFAGILKKINERLKSVLPEGVESLKPEDTTPEATAERIVKSVTALFDGYAKRHPELEGEELVAGFMDTIRSGVQQGYDDAVSFLEGAGAFQVDGVKSGIEKTKSLIEEKLKLFESKKLEELNTAKTVSDQLAAQAGAGLAIAA